MTLIHFHLKKQHKFSQGFTLIEMLVVVGIFVMISSVLLHNYNNFNSRLSLDMLAHQIAQWTRDTQVSAMSVRPSRTNITKFSGFGLYFDANTPTSFIYFADLNGDKRYTPLAVGQQCGDAGVECERQIAILKNNKIEQICGADLGLAHPAGSCATGLESVQNFDIVFTRPNPDASIFGEYVLGSPFQYAHADITVVSPNGYRRTIQIWTTGQISVQ